MDDRVHAEYIYEDMGNEMRPSREDKSKIVLIRPIFFSGRFSEEIFSEEFRER